MYTSPKCRRDILIAVLVAIGIVSIARAERGDVHIAILYVAPDGIDSGECVRLHPCRTIQYAVDRASPGHEIRVASGLYTDTHVYADHTQVVYLTRTISIRGGYTTTDWLTPNPLANPTTLDARGLGRVFYITGALTVTLDGLRITGGYTQLNGGGVYMGNRNLTLNNSQVLSNTADDSTGDYGSGGGLYLSGGNDVPIAVTLSGNVIATNTASASGGGVHLYHCNATLTNNTIRANSAVYGSGVYVSQSDPTLTNNAITDNHSVAGSGLHFLSSVPRLLHNTIARNTGSAGIHASNNSTVRLVNAIVVSHTAGIHIDSGSAVSLNGVLWYDNLSNASGAGAINVTHAYTGNPAFAADGYHLAANSAAIDRGVSAGVTDDLDSQPRPMGAAPDLGADETVPLASVAIAGPASGFLNASYRFTATASPPTGTLPVAYTWVPTPTSGQGTAQAAYTWTTGGPRTITVAAANLAVVTGTHTITIAAVPGPIVINEVLYNGRDDSKIVELYNRGDSAVSLTGYNLLIGSAGYYTFPLFSLAPGAFVAVHVNVTGTNTNTHLFTGQIGGSMSDITGSVVLFSITHSAATMVDFVQYGASGQVWESAAQDAGLWIAGEYARGVGSGRSINLSPDGNNYRHAGGDWQACYPTAASSNCSITRTLAYLPVVVRDWPPGPPAPRPIPDPPDACPGVDLSETDYVSQSFEHENDNDWYSFKARAGVTYRIETGRLGSRADTILELHDVNCGQIIASNDDISPSDRASRIVWTAPAAGRYHVNVRPYD